jgi:hypothetical protein
MTKIYSNLQSTPQPYLVIAYSKSGSRMCTFDEDTLCNYIFPLDKGQVHGGTGVKNVP